MGARTLLAILALGIASPAFAQAWVPPAGIGVVSVVYQSIDNTNHRLTDGSLLDGYDSVSRGALFNLDYAITDRFSFSIGVPYLGSEVHGPGAKLLRAGVDDCFCWQHGWQDFGGTARYNVINGAFAFTPSISFGVPSHNYDYFGEAVLGRNLNEIRLAVDVGHRLDRISDRLSVSARYSYAIVEKVLDLPNNRSNIAVESGFLATRRLATRVMFSWQRSHGGLRSNEDRHRGAAVAIRPPDQGQQLPHHRRPRYSLPKFDLFASYVTMPAEPTRTSAAPSRLA